MGRRKALRLVHIKYKPRQDGPLELGNMTNHDWYGDKVVHEVGERQGDVQAVQEGGGKEEDASQVVQKDGVKKEDA